ncbi:MAG: glycoside hydrolase [Candidatus Koribacter versatilis]|uniref:Glycoside hydrolase n=1 Tax=Candidatus Korobacter versatilis TaxID=658062 RepID=A0A932A674_9BACT|nr:glycoside hydrolase [Candidatus Koribacter versatilis]
MNLATASLKLARLHLSQPMPAIRVVFLWHMHQPFYKDLVTGEYRLPWVRMHALKDYYGMVKLLDEFPSVHQTFNLVPSLIQQIQDYVAGTARDPFLEVAAKPAADLTEEERRFALTYLFQANETNLMGRYRRYRELWEKLKNSGSDAARAERYFTSQDVTDLQVLSQLAWFDEFFLEEPDTAALIRKGSGFSSEDREHVVAKQRELLGRVVPAYASAAQRGGIEVSTSPFYHPILPLVCDTDAGRVSSPGLAVPTQRFQHPEDAREQLLRGIELHEKTFGVRPRGAWPSEGSVSDEVMRIAHELGLKWMATDEGVLARSLGVNFTRDGSGGLQPEAAGKLYSPWRFEQPGAQMDLLFRDHSLSDLIGFVYSGMAAKEAAGHFIHSIRKAAQPIVESGRDATISIIVDGENAWEYYPESGRDFLRFVYDELARDPQLEPVTVAEAIARQGEPPVLKALVPGSWINANFNVWIGAPEDNKAWDYLAAARERFAESEATVTPAQRALAYEELLIAEGSDWNWWYGPEHHSANDRDFDELYRKHLSNVYHALGQAPPDYLAQPIAHPEGRPYFVPQTAFIHPRIDGDPGRYFDWIGAAMYTADHRAAAMHGKQFMLDALYAGIDEENLYGRLDFIGPPPRERLEVKLHFATGAPGEAFQLSLTLASGMVVDWRLGHAVEGEVAQALAPGPGIEVALQKMLEFKLPLAAIGVNAGGRIGIRCTIWRDALPVDALPAEGEMRLDVLSETELGTRA